MEELKAISDTVVRWLEGYLTADEAMNQIAHMLAEQPHDPPDS